MTYRVLFARCFVLLVLSVAASFCPARPAFAQTYTFRLLHTFTGGNDGANPVAGVIADSQGNLYGTASNGGTDGGGVLFQYTASGGLQMLVSFNGNDGYSPQAKLTIDSQGNLYGTTSGGGTGGAGVPIGTLFKYNGSGGLQTLASFTEESSSLYPNGYYPAGSVSVDSQSNVWGTARFGGTSREGTLFRYSASDGLRSFFTFNGADGSIPSGGLIADSQGYLYGTTQYGGANGDGEVFKFTSGPVTGAQLQALANFSGANGSGPVAGLIADSQGNLYGTTQSGGASNDGVVFKYSASGGLQALASFNGANGSAPVADLIADSQGNLYGTTEDGGAHGDGTVFKYSASGGLQTLYSFTGGNDGEDPMGSLLLDSQGDLFGTASSGGADGNGTLFELQPAASTPEPGSLALFAGLTVSGAGLLRRRRAR